MSGMLAVIVAQGLLLSLGFWFIGVHSPVLWGMIAGLASIVPVVGAFLIWAPVVIAYVLQGSLLAGSVSGPLGCPHSGIRR